MKSYVGYSQGTGKNIATQEIDQDGDIVHFQRFAPGAGALNLEELIAYRNTTVAESAITDCKGAGRIVLAINQDTDGSKLKVHFYDENKNDIGSSDEIVPLKTTKEAYLEVLGGWSGLTSYPKGTLRKIVAAGHIYQQTEVDGVSGAVEPTWPTNGGTVADGTCVWHDFGPYSASLKTTPSAVFSNSMGASYFKAEITVIVGNIVVYGGVL